MLGIVRLAAGVLLVVAGAEVFFKGLLAAAGRLRVPAFVLTVLVSGLELENLAAGIAANAHRLPDAAAGTFLGGTTFLALGVAGLGAVIAPFRWELPRRVLVWTALSPVPLLLLSRDRTLSRADGVLLLVWFLVVMAAMSRAGLETAAEEEVVGGRWWPVRIVGGLAVLAGAGDLLGRGIRDVVGRFAVPQALLGNTVVAAGVEAEEVGRVAVPARRGRGDVALANIIGTIAHFAAFNAGVIALVKPLRLHGASVSLHVPVAAGSTLLVCALAGRKRGLGRGEGAALLAFYAAYVVAAVLA